jgi:parallel beta-helix repeat protein
LNRIDNNTALRARQGILISLSDNNTISSNMVSEGGEGISLNSSKYNNISGNNISFNDVGIFLCAGSHPNLIYNNYFRNAENADADNARCTWYIQPTKGKNIVSGSYIGGNFWGFQIGDGFSETATDGNGDGIANAPYTSTDGNIIDRYPLVAVIVPAANFNANPTSGNVPLSVQFTDLSQNAESRTWDFGDGTFSTEQNLTHTYSIAGNYTVKLTAINANGTDSKSARITVLSKAILPVFLGYTNPPTDINHDDHYEDVNGNGIQDFDDVVAYYDNMDWIGKNAPVTFFDYNNNNLVDFDDIVKLYDML